MAGRRSVVVTGASTGIGWACVKVLTANDFHVFGSVRKQADAERLSKEFGNSFTPLVFDVTDQAAVAAGAKQVAAALGDSTLFGLVNNAGMAVPGPLLHLKIADFEHQLAVNLTGQLIVTQAMAPLLGADRTRKGAPGRIVMISSVGGKNALPFAGPYAASKFALEGLSESLRRELMLFGIDVIVVAPGSVATPIWDKAEAIDIAQFESTPYAAALKTMRSFMLVARPQGPSGRADRRGGQDRAHDGQAEGPLHGRAESAPAAHGRDIAQAHHGQALRPPPRTHAADVMSERALFAHQPPPRSDGGLAVTITHLELAPADWTRRGRPPDRRIDIERSRSRRPRSISISTTASAGRGCGTSAG